MRTRPLVLTGLLALAVAAAAVPARAESCPNYVGNETPEKVTLVIYGSTENTEARGFQIILDPQTSAVEDMGFGCGEYEVNGLRVMSGGQMVLEWDGSMPRHTDEAVFVRCERIMVGGWSQPYADPLCGP